MKANILYPKKYSVYTTSPHDSWMMRVQFKDRYPTPEEIITDYVVLPFTLDVETKEEAFSIMNNYENNPLGCTSDNDEEGKKMQQWLLDHDLDHTSMSVGDIIVLKGKAFLCMSSGWKEIELSDPYKLALKKSLER